MPQVTDICDFLHRLAPLELAEPWDNVGLLVGSREQTVQRVMTCLTVTPETVDEAVREEAELILVHHPFPFHPLKRVTTDTPMGRLLSRLIRAEISVYSAHTAFDSAARGINQQLIERIGCGDIRPLVSQPPTENVSANGSARYGRFLEPRSIGQIVADLRHLVGRLVPRITRGSDAPVQQVAVACGSGGSFLQAAIDKRCDLFIVGEASFHTCLDAKAQGVRLLLMGHYASERFAMEGVAERVAQQFNTLTV
ncbi:MAG: Nif3-like dinuclear metal center hexameric protein, partial [Planctomycetota bacterium]|nr:Nif3-like dinuclear metal center hexameric protein [Planctomycetota bacterium]